jgi:hypothetical protein
MNRKVTQAQSARASGLFDLASSRIDQRLGKRVFDASTVRALNADESASLVQSFSDGDCENELTPVRP